MLYTLKYKDYTLEDIKETFTERNEEEINKIYENFKIETIQEGILLTGLNFDHRIEEDIVDSFEMLIVKDGVLIDTKDMYDDKTPFHEKIKFMEENDISDSYGVCDSYEQVIDKFGLIESNLKVTISLTPIYKEHQTESGGWRWHKWGQYIGEHEITSEYLYDEEKIDMVYVYHIFVLKEEG